LAEEVSQRLHDADDAERIALNPHFLVDGIFERKQRLLHINTDDQDV